MTEFKHGTYFKNLGLKNAKKIVIGDDTKDADITEFLKGCDEGLAKKIKSGNSKEAKIMKVDFDEKAKKLASKKKEDSKK